MFTNNLIKEAKAMTNKESVREVEEIEDYTHYFRTCWSCGNTWWGLHCPHDGYQNPCPECGEKPEQAVIKNPKSDTCGCEFVIEVETATALLVKAVIAGRIEELESLELYWTPERWNEYKKLLPKSQHKDAKNSVFFNGAINYILKDRLSDLKAQIVSKEAK